MSKCLYYNVFFAFIVAVVLSESVAFGATRDEVVKRGFLQCGVATSMPGFADPDTDGYWRGFDVDICRAVAAAVLGDREKVKFTPLAPKERFPALQVGKVDMLAGSTTWTLARDSSLGVNFPVVTYYDGQGFMAKKSLENKDINALHGVSVCVQPGTNTEPNLADFFARKDLKQKTEERLGNTLVRFTTSTQLVKGFAAGRCDVVSGPISLLYSLRSKMVAPDEVVILPGVISKEPLGPVVRQGDDAWFNIVKWVVFAMINGEELGLNSTSIAAMKDPKIPAVRRFFGLEGIKGQGLGLADDWAYQVISQVGNYGEVFQRNLGQGSLLGMDRGINALWVNGGLHYAPPLR